MYAGPLFSETARRAHLTQLTKQDSGAIAAAFTWRLGSMRLLLLTPHICCAQAAHERPRHDNLAHHAANLLDARQSDNPVPHASCWRANYDDGKPNEGALPPLL